MKEIISRKIKVVTNAGGMNPEGLKAVIEQTAAFLAENVNNAAPAVASSGVEP